MKTEEDEAFDELARRQGAWGGGFTAKRQAAMDKINSEFHEKYIKYRTAFPKGYIAPKQESVHWSDCAVHNGPAYPAGLCDCGATEPWNEDEWRRNNWRCGHGWLRGEQCEICNAPQPAQEPYDQTALELCEVCGWKTLIPDDGCLNCERKEKPIQQEALYGMNQDDWKDVVAAIAKVRDGRGIYLGCRPADVFQDWFLALGTAKVKEKNG
jgi:hypothetical protein